MLATNVISHRPVLPMMRPSMTDQTMSQVDAKPPGLTGVTNERAETAGRDRFRNPGSRRLSR
jgi:hypothetical protein